MKKKTILSGRRTEMSVEEMDGVRVTRKTVRTWKIEMEGHVTWTYMSLYMKSMLPELGSIEYLGDDAAKALIETCKYLNGIFNADKTICPVFQYPVTKSGVKRNILLLIRPPKSPA